MCACPVRIIITKIILEDVSADVKIADWLGWWEGGGVWSGIETFRVCGRALAPFVGGSALKGGRRKSEISVVEVLL